MTVEICPTCGDIDPDHCKCVRQRTYKRARWMDYLYPQNGQYAHSPYIPPIPSDTDGRTTRAARHVGPPWTCNHVEHDTIESRWKP